MARSQIRVYFKGRAESQISPRPLSLFTPLIVAYAEGGERTFFFFFIEEEKKAVKWRYNCGKTAANREFFGSFGIFINFSFLP
jgi:hypothetical protein